MNTLLNIINPSIVPGTGSRYSRDYGNFLGKILFLIILIVVSVSPDLYAHPSPGSST